MACPLLDLRGGQLPSGLVEHPSACKKVSFQRGRFVPKFIVPVRLFENRTRCAASREVGGHAIDGDAGYRRQLAVCRYGAIGPFRAPVDPRQTQQRAGLCR